MDIQKLKEHLINNQEYIEDLLCKYFDNVKYYPSSLQWRFSFHSGDNQNSCRLCSETLNFKNYKYGDTGDILSLLMKKLNRNLGKIINMLAKNTFYIEKEEKKIEIYGGIFKKISKNVSKNPIKYYNQEEIERYPKIISSFFLDEGISVSTQSVFNIRYCEETNRIIIPIYYKSKLIGAIGRYNKKESGSIPKYLPVINYNKSDVVFGVDINYANLVGGQIIVVESEKMVLEAYSKGYRNVIALGGNNISGNQRNLILGLNPSEIILALDKGLGLERAVELGVEPLAYMENLIKERCSMLESRNNFINPNIYYVNLNEISVFKNGEGIFDREINLDNILEHKKALH